MRKKLLLVCMSLLLTVSFMMPQRLMVTVHAEENESETTEVNQDDENIEEPGRSSKYGSLGYVQDNIELDKLRHSKYEPKDRDYLPSRYSLVEKGFVTSVKNQNPYGTCWTFATMGSAESGILKKYGVTKDLAELQLAYYTFDSYQRPDAMGLITNDGGYTDDQYILDLGGNSTEATFALASGIGFCDESDYPYADEAAVYEARNGTGPCYKTTYRLKAARWYDMHETNVIKNALMNYGALAVSYYHYDYYGNYTASGEYAYYQDYTYYTNHAVTLVGWDDSFSKENFSEGARPSKNGAWLLKNSWDTWFGNEGYFWISYEDKSLLDSMAVFFEAELNGDYSPERYHVYQYDGGSASSWYTLGSTAYEANIYTAAFNNEYLTEVGFVAGQSEIDYTIYIYKGVSVGNPTSGTKVHEQTGYLSDAGYYLIPLDKTISLSKGDKYSVVIKLYSSSGNDVDLYVDTRYNIDYTDGTSIILYNDTTNDLSYYSYNGTSWNDLSRYGDTARIKAITVTSSMDAPVIKSVSMNTTGVTLKWDEISSADEYLIYRKQGTKDYAQIGKTSSTSFTDESAWAGTEYTYAVKASNSVALSAYSSAKTVTYNPFKDVKSTSAHYKNIMWAFNNDLVNGTSKTTFSPEGTCMRKSFAIMLWKLNGRPAASGTNPFTDIDGLTSNEKKAIQWCYKNKIVSGMTKTTFAPEGDVTRKAVVIMLWKAAGRPEVVGSDNPFTDISKLSANEKSAILWAYENGITKGTTKTTFGPEENCTREQLCTFLARYNNLLRIMN